jgi:hypothetical protein
VEQINARSIFSPATGFIRRERRVIDHVGNRVGHIASGDIQLPIVHRRHFGRGADAHAQAVVHLCDQAHLLVQIAADVVAVFQQFSRGLPAKLHRRAGHALVLQDRFGQGDAVVEIAVGRHHLALNIAVRAVE